MTHRKRNSLRYFLREIPKRSPRFLIRRGGDVLRRGFRSLQAKLGFEPYRAQGLGRGGTALGTLLDLRSVDRSVQALRDSKSPQLTNLRARATRIAEGEHELFGRIYRMDQVEWHRDFETGHAWPIRFHTRYGYEELIDLQRPTDIKLPWELGRLQMLPRLALASRISGDTSYARVAKALFDSWDSANPVGYGIQWVVGMEVALRSISLILTAEILADRDTVDDFVTDRLVQSLEEHGRFLYRNVEYSDVNGNHHTSCLLGLLYLGVWLPSAREAGAWRHRALEGLRREMQLQTYPDGICHEGSIPYHRLVAEIFLHAEVVCRRSGLDLGQPYRERLEKMLRFVADYMNVLGRAPAWGDGDDGRVHQVGSQPIDDHRYLPILGAAFFNRPELFPHFTELPLDAILLLDRETAKSLEHRAARPAATRRGYVPSGYFLFRHGAHGCFVDCADVGLRGRGGHGHNDALSFTLRLDDRDVILDTGNASYTRSVSDRIACLSARAHNVALIDDREPAAISLDRIPHATACPTEVVEWDPERATLTGRHLGYVDRSTLGPYERSWTLTEEGLTLVDRLMGEGRHRIEWFLHLADIWNPEVIENSWVRLTDPTGRSGVSIRVDHSDIQWTIEAEPWYPRYGLERTRHRLVALLDTSLPVTLSFEIKVLSSS